MYRRITMKLRTGKRGTPDLCGTTTCTHERPCQSCLIACLEWRRAELIALLVKLGMSLHDAEDIAQETFVVGFEAVLSGDAWDILNRDAWLRSVAVRKARTEFRRQR